MRTLVRIAAALERIALALEAENLRRLGSVGFTFKDQGYVAGGDQVSPPGRFTST